MKAFFLALQFLTIIPIGSNLKFEKKDFGCSLRFFPVIGLISGCFLCFIWLSFSGVAVLARSALIIIASVIITGGLHIDGLADTCDGLYGFHSREKTLRIMRDSQIGAMGAMAIVCLLIAKFAFIASIPNAQIYKILLAMPVLSRWAMTFACCGALYPRKEGKAKLFVEGTKGKEIFAAGVSVLVLYVWFWQLKGVLVFLLTLLCVGIFKQYAQKKIGGMTGDTIGAVNEIAEMAMLFFALQIL
ncbi:MAG: adenosylcobinamide-GDP ribazoletransferase [Candidatus Omnitrophica bacterium]|nr:adenosylcobinamide-GDP ribazoletransferase [Candidatus Omnitrophota bacterium]